MENKLDRHVPAYQRNNAYDFDNEILLTWYPQRILMHSKGARSALELGLGHGFATEILAAAFDRHLVVEASPAIIKNFRKHFPHCTPQIADVFFEEFRTDEKFDVIVMGFILEHVESPFDIIRQYKTFLARGGKIFVAVPNAQVLNRRLGCLAGMLDDVETLSENDLLLGHKRYYTLQSLSTELERAGCQVDKVEGIYLKPFTSKQMLSLNLGDRVIRALCEIGVDYPELACGILAQVSVP